jgi:hypothetical protein
MLRTFLRHFRCIGNSCIHTSRINRKSAKQRRARGLITVPEAAKELGSSAIFGCSVRLSNAIDRHVVEPTLADYLTDPQILKFRLGDKRNVGRKSVNEATEKITAFLEAARRRDPPSPPDSRSAREKLSDAVKALPEREDVVIVGRYGFELAAFGRLR